MRMEGNSIFVLARAASLVDTYQSHSSRQYKTTLLRPTLTEHTAKPRVLNLSRPNPTVT